MVAQNSRNAPRRSGIVTASSASRASPTSARSATKRRRSKLTLAPLATATSVRSRAPSRATHRLSPATARAPAGSITVRVSSKMSLIAAHVSSLLTRTTSSTVSFAMSNVRAPTCRTATPSAKMPTWSSSTRRPSSSDRCMASASNGSTPTTRTPGCSDLT